MFDYNHRIALLNELVHHLKEDFYVFEMQAGRRLVKDVEGVARPPFPKFGGKFHPLAFSPGKCHGRLAELDVAESDIHKCLEFLCN